MMLGPKSPENDKPKRVAPANRALVKRPYYKTPDKEKMKEFANETRYDSKGKAKKK